MQTHRLQPEKLHKRPLQVQHKGRFNYSLTIYSYLIHGPIFSIHNHKSVLQQHTLRKQSYDFLLIRHTTFR